MLDVGCSLPLIALSFALPFTAPAAEVRPAIKPQAQEFPLSSVKLLDGPFLRAMETDKAFLLSIDPDKLLAGFRAQAGLPKKAEPYRGWEAINPTNRYTMAGHSLGHYLSALVFMASATGDAECRRRADYIVAELAECQKAGGTGMLCAVPDCKAMFAEIAAGDIRSDHLFRLNGGYVPFYSLHKVMAGLRDAWLVLGNPTARDVLVRQTDWLASVFEKLSDKQVQDVLETEHGGIMESAADVYAITGDAKYLALARRLDHKELFDPLARGEDPLTSRPPARPVHANAQIPKVIGMERVYELTGEKEFATAARSFWDNVVNMRSFVIGGHGENEFFFPIDAFATRGLTSPSGPETCNTYNLLKLSRQLWLVEPTEPVAYFVERALFNHILSSQDPEQGGFCYFTSMRPGAYRTYCTATNDFWCCTGTGMENHAKCGEFIYAHSGDKLWVDLFIASELNWAQQGATIRLDTRFPEDGKATLTFTLKQPRKLSIAVRCPAWLKPGAMELAVNGAAERVEAKPGSYAVVERTWKTGDKLQVDWPLVLRTEMLPGSREWVAVLRGPIVLAGEMGAEGLERVNFHGRNYIANRTLPIERFPVFIGTTNDVVTKIKPVAGKPLEFRTDGLASPNEVTLAPFYTVHGQRYSIYWRLTERTGDAANSPAGNPPPTIASTSKASSPRTNYQYIVNAINDQREPNSSRDRGKRHFDWWPVKGTNQWVQYDFAKPARVSAVEVYWFDDTGIGECRLPRSWQVLWRDQGEWKPVTHPSGYGCEGNRYNRTTFDPVETDGLRLDVLLPKGYSSGLLQWKVE